ncbi:regulatory protein [Arthrobacter stackebrandtii]|uniref:Regulatory protein RecX n=1 Tax=Arthrobacter stackebrandtii TaxID=272161 RepID=A0ABS4YTJ0_9MICC|nr:regulatory protein RecX [Arthrobacter stackebrandtii]MBP2411268.1 regulatory protein [Arthrobacter stackebrandtii]PYH00102.1 RecX family transcriptional regulator [Arthrobacter stackebrandtii]
MNRARPAPELDPDANPASVARSIVLRQLTNSAKSRHQLAQKLAERNIPEDVAEAVLDRFESVKLIDDAEFAHMWVRSRSMHKSLARGALRRELAEKGIAPDLAEQALEQIDDDIEREQGKDLVRRKLRTSIDLSDRAERDKYTRRWVGMLARKGFNPSLAFGMVAEVIDESRQDD